MKNTLLKGSLYLACCVVIFGMMGCEESIQRSARVDTYYLKYNLHYYLRTRDRIASVANFIRCPNHGFYPYNTAVKVDTYRNGFIFTIKETREVIYMECSKAHLGNKSRTEYLDLIVSPTAVNYTGISGVNQKGISEAKPYEGMSKQGILIALGYPAPGFTPSLDSDVWQYWYNRYLKCLIHFEDEKVVKIK